MMESNMANRYAPEVRARAVRMVFEHQGSYETQAGASIAPRIGCISQTLREWVKQAEKESGIRFVTPDARHAGLDRATLANRDNLYADARAQHPERTLVSQNPQLATSQTHMAQPQNRHQRPWKQRRRMTSADNSFDTHRVSAITRSTTPPRSPAWRLALGSSKST